MIRWAELNVILANMPLGVGLLVDKETLINYQLVISYRLLIRNFKDLDQSTNC